MPRKSLILGKNKLLNNRRLIKHEDHTYSTKAHKIAPRKIKLYVDCKIPSNESDNSNNEVFEEIITFDKDATIMLPDQEYIQNHSISHDNSFLLKLRIWATSFNVKHSASSKLFKILAKDAHLTVPMDVRTLLSTPLSTELRHIKTIDNGKYIHFGVRNCLECLLDSLQKKYVLYTDVSILRMSFNIDGASISASGGSSFWLVLGCVQNLLHIIKPTPVFAVGIFMAFGKPDNLNNFLEDFVTEMESLLNSGLTHNSRSYQIKFHSCVCDAPAMASVKQIKGHGGYYCCPKCFTKGVSTTSRNGRKVVVYPDINTQLRSDKDFRSRKTPSGNDDSDHHKSSRSIFERLPIDMIANFPLDKMHLVDEGVCKKLISAWLGKPSEQKLKAEQLSKLNKRLEQCYLYACSEFQRKTRTLHFVNYLKASELRVFLLYTGPVSLKKIINSSAYKHFLCLSLAIRILTSPFYYYTYNDYAQELLTYFVRHFQKLYGINNVTFNVHGLVHLANDAKILGPLDENSCYKFEAYIKHIISMLHSSVRPLEQCYNRIHELNQTNNLDVIDTNKEKPVFGKIVLATNKFRLCNFCNFKINANSFNDNCLMLRDGRIIVRVKYFEKARSDVCIFGQLFNYINTLNEEPGGLEEFFMFLRTFPEKILKYDISDVKFVIFLMKTAYALFLH